MPDSVLNFLVKLFFVITCFGLNSVNSSSNVVTLSLLSGKESAALNCSIYSENDVLVANCSNLNWTFVDLRCVPVTTQVLLLDRNNLTTLTNGSFQSLTALRQLSIQSSNVHQIEIDTFQGLGHLQNLNLENNELRDDVTSLDPQMFRHLTNLKQLFIGNNENLSQNVKDAFMYLQNLSTLSMDVSGTLQLGTEFSNLTKLKNLTLYCSNVTNITNESFIGLWNSNVTILNLINFNRLKFDPEEIDQDTSQKQFSDDAFQNLSRLEVLVIVNCKIGNENLARKFKHFINSSLHTLYLETTHYTRTFYSPNATFQDGVLLPSTVRYLSQLNLSYFSWVDSNIFAIAPGVISSPQWRHNLKLLDFSNNMMGWLGWMFPLLEVSRLEKLEKVIVTSPSPENKVSHPYLDIDDILENVKRPPPLQVTFGFSPKQSMTVSNTSNKPGNFHSPESKDISKNKAYDGAILQALPLKNDLKNIESSSKEVASRFKPIAISPYKVNAKLSSLSEQDIFKNSDNPPYPTNSGTWTIRMPPSLRTIKFMFTVQGDSNNGNQSCRFIQNEREAPNVTHFYYVGNSVTRGTGRIMGLTNLQLFDMSKNSLIVEPYFFDEFPTLRYLMLQSMRNEDFFQRVSIDRIIQNMPELRYLDLTDNKLNFLPPDLFSRNSHITHVILAKNRFSSFPITMNLVPNLKTLDLTGNALSYLKEEEMTALTKHSKNVPHFYLALIGNNIVCVCSQIKFMIWLNISDFLDNKGNYSCTSQEGQLISTQVLLHDVSGLYRQCFG